jgi:hypothetical protein
MRRVIFFAITAIVIVLSLIAAINSFDTKPNILNAYAF